MTVVEPVLVDLYPLHADLEAFPREGLASNAMETTMNSVDNEAPVHHLLAVEKMAVENESKGCKLFVLAAVRV
jgi:hypothetical protein